ncbi:hypothetical protein ACRS8P_33055 [Burkholderia cenocepacia]
MPSALLPDTRRERIAVTAKGPTIDVAGCVVPRRAAGHQEAPK